MVRNVVLASLRARQFLRLANAAQRQGLRYATARELALAASLSSIVKWRISTRSSTARPAPVPTFTTREEAEDELAAVLEDEPEWRPDLWVEPFELVVAE